VPVPPADQVLPKQERGSRPARPLPYAPLVDAVVTAASGTIGLTFTGGAAAGAGFHVTAGNRADGPWAYSTGAGLTISGSWDTAATKGVYDLTVHGPNGFPARLPGLGGRQRRRGDGPPRGRHRPDRADLRQLRHRHRPLHRPQTPTTAGARRNSVRAGRHETHRSTWPAASGGTT